MRKKLTRVLVVALGLSWALFAFATPAYAFGGGQAPLSAAAESVVVSSTGLIEHPKEYDGKSVVFEGEAVGELMRRGEYGWLHLNDDAYGKAALDLDEVGLSGFNSGMPVWAPYSEASAASTFGDYKHRGDTVRVSGTFNAACAQHGGDTDIHADLVQVVEIGTPIDHEIPAGKMIAAIVLALFAAVLYVIEHRSRRVRMM